MISALSIDTFETYVHQYLATYNTPGLSLVVTNREQTLYRGLFGWADLERQAPVTAETRFYVASLGKAMTAAVLLQAAEAGDIDLDRPVSDYLPWFQVNSDFDAVTPRHLMSHSSGLICGSDFCPASAYEVLALRETRTTAAPGARFHYSNVGYKLLGQMLAQVYGIPFPTLLQNRLLQPLGMQRSLPCYRGYQDEGNARGYIAATASRPQPSDARLIPSPLDHIDSADGCPVLDSEDMARWLRHLLSDDRNVKAMQTARVTVGEGESYGYGLFLKESEAGPRWHHGGQAPGFLAGVWGCSQTGLAIGIAANGPLRRFMPPPALFDFFEAAVAEKPLPATPSINRYEVHDPAAYEGRFLAGDEAVVFRAEDKRLWLQKGEVTVPAEPRGPRSFFIDHPNLNTFLWTAVRRDNDVTAFYHGDRCWQRQGFETPLPPTNPAWVPLLGSYRSHNPWESNLHLFVREGRLWLHLPMGYWLPLYPTDDPLFFKTDTDPEDPEWLRFDPPVAGRCLRLHKSTCAFYRADT